MENLTELETTFDQLDTDLTSLENSIKNKNFNKWHKPMITEETQKLFRDLSKRFVSLSAKYYNYFNQTQLNEEQIIKIQNTQKNIENRMMIINAHIADLDSDFAVNNSRFTFIISTVSLIIAIISLIIGVISYIIANDQKDTMDCKKSINNSQRIK